MHLIGYLENLIEGKNGDHSHLMSEDYKKEIMLCIYDPMQINNFHPRIKKLLEDDE